MLTDEAKTFLQTGCGLIVATAGDTGVPHAGRAWGLDVLDADRIRVLLPTADAAMLDDLADDGWLAVTGADVRTLRSMQLKGRVVAIEPASVDDYERSGRYVDDFFTAIGETDGTARSLLERMVPAGLLGCDMIVASVYDQTPGPSAGSSMQPAGGGRA